MLLTGLTVVSIAACGKDSPTPGPASAAERPGGAKGAPASTPPPAEPAVLRADGRFASLERRYDATIGLSAIDTGTGRTLVRRPDTRFAFCSTGKALAAAAILGERTSAQLDAVVRYGPEVLQANSPITEQHVGTGMTLRALAAAAVKYSDNAAANLLLKDLGGPKALERFLAGHGDDVTRMSRYEPDLSTAIPGDTRDTTTARQLAEDLRTFALGDALAKGRRAQLVRWLRDNTTGDALIRAGVPDGWEVGDKTGSGGYGTRNDVAVLWPPDRPPIVLAILTTRGREGAERDDRLVAAAARVAVDELTGGG